MTSLQILMVDPASPFRNAFANALSFGGHQVRVSDADVPPNDFALDFVVFGESAAPAGADEQRRLVLRRPVNMEEL